jgi:ABC-type xylose transport system permease subunit
MDDPWEMKLKQALARSDPPEGFAERVMDRVARGEAPQPQPSRWPLLGWLLAPAWRTALAGALACLLLLTAGLAYREHRLRLKAEAERARAEQAREELILALRITGVQLNRARNIVLRQMDFRKQQENVRQ